MPVWLNVGLAIYEAREWTFSRISVLTRTSLTDRLIRDYTRYGDLAGALRRGTGMNIADLEERWLVYLKLRVSWIPIITSVSTLWFVAALIFVYGYMRKKRHANRRLKEMETEEKSKEWHPDV